MWRRRKRKDTNPARHVVLTVTESRGGYGMIKSDRPNAGLESFDGGEIAVAAGLRGSILFHYPETMTRHLQRSASGAGGRRRVQHPSRTALLLLYRPLPALAGGCCGGFRCH